MTHSIMFHHFHSELHSHAQGSLSASDFDLMISWLNDRYNIINAQEYIKKFLSRTLENTDICLSFDDGLKCQYDIALPILEKNNIRAFFFVQSSVLSKKPDFVEIFRYFRTSHFDNINEFYNDFFRFLLHNDKDHYLTHKKQYSEKNYLSAFPFYTENDRWFRYIRDQYLGEKKYTEIMLKMISEKGLNIKEAQKKLLMNDYEILKIHQNGHIIGLHSHSHPTQMSNLNKEQQLNEYKKNLKYLNTLLETKDIISMSHPCGDYNLDTLNVLKELGIQIGFRSNMSIRESKSPLEIPREDQANIFKEMML